MKQHIQMIMTFAVERPPTDPAIMNETLRALVREIDMEPLTEPFSVYCHQEGNRGLTAIALITTSHIAFHSWDEETPAMVEFDIFSCKQFDPNVVLEFVDRHFGTLGVSFILVDRSATLKKNKFWMVYETTNLINGKRYIGVHASSRCRDHYLGSGTVLKAAIKKYGRENFQRKILKLFTDARSAYAYEQQIVNADLIKSEQYYNLTLGGRTAFKTDNAHQAAVRSAKRRPRCWLTKNDQSIIIFKSEMQSYLDLGWVPGRFITEETRARKSIAGKGKTSHRKGKSLSESHRLNIQKGQKQTFASGRVQWNKGKKRS